MLSENELYNYFYRFGKRSVELEDGYVKRGIDEVIRPRYIV